jgi:hypothetical protein
MNNMRFMILIMLYDVIQVLNIKRRLSNKDEHFSKYILFTMIYLLTKKWLNDKYHMSMYAKIQCINMHVFL